MKRLTATLLSSLLATAAASPRYEHARPQFIPLEVPSSPPPGASIEHSPSYLSFSFEPAFWVEFFGNLSHPNTFTFDALATLIAHGARPRIRPGGITMDSMIFDPEGGDPERTTSPSGGVYRTTVGPAYYQSWGHNFPNGTEFISTLNFGNDSLAIARDMAVASVRYGGDVVIADFELGNEPTNYPSDRWDNSTAAYVAQWQDFTTAIGAATGGASDGKWWASSATTDVTGLRVRPADLIPAGIDATGQVAQYSIHSYAFATCDAARASLATIGNILNHTGLVTYADTEILPSAQAALASGGAWIVGEFNSIACSGNPGVSDTFAQALWEADTELIYAARNASAAYLHQGATLVLQSADQTNTAGDDGTPGYSTYDFLYPRDSGRRGARRVLPGYAGLLFLAEAFATEGTRVQALETPRGGTVDGDHFSAYAFYVGGRLRKLALLNLTPYYANSTSDFMAAFDVFGRGGPHPHRGRRQQAWVKRMTAPHVDEQDADQVTWAGQSYRDATAVGEVEVEEVGRDGVVEVRGSEAVLVFFDCDDVRGT